MCVVGTFLCALTNYASWYIYASQYHTLLVSGGNGVHVLLSVRKVSHPFVNRRTGCLFYIWWLEKVFFEASRIAHWYSRATSLKIRIKAEIQLDTIRSCTLLAILRIQKVHQSLRRSLTVSYQGISQLLPIIT